MHVSVGIPEMTESKAATASLDGALAEVRLFSNRGQACFSAKEIPDIWRSRLVGCSAAWSSLAGKFERAPALDTRVSEAAGKSLTVWKLAVGDGRSQMDRIAPCRFVALVKLGDKFYHFNGTYPTVSVKPCPSVGGMVLVNFAETEETVDTSHLQKVRCISSSKFDFGDGQSIQFQVALVKMEKFDAGVCKDDVTGEVYPYALKSLFVVVGKKT